MSMQRALASGPPMKTVLIVEDNDDIRDLFAEALTDAGYVVHTAAHGRRALELLETIGGEPCLVLLDMMMPVMDGKEFLKVVHETHRVASLPIVLISAVDNERNPKGVRRVIRKPVRHELLLQVVNEFCGPA